MQDNEPNIAKTLIEAAQKFSDHAIVNTTDGSTLIIAPDGRRIHDVTADLRRNAEYTHPHSRRGTATMENLRSLIEWANRNKGEGSVIFASCVNQRASMQVIADYHMPGAPNPTDLGEDTARHCQHRAIYHFPLSKKWQAWSELSGSALTAPEMGAFLENNILDVIDPPMALTLPGKAGQEATDAEQRLIDIAARLNTRYGSAQQLFSMASSFTVYESSDLEVAVNSTSGEGRVMVKSEHRDAAGRPIEVPKLFLIAIPVFEMGQVYRIPVRFQYRKHGGNLKFILTLHEPEPVFDDAFMNACGMAHEQTNLPLFQGCPEQ